MQISDFKSFLDKKRGEHAYLVKHKEELDKVLANFQENKTFIEEAQTILQQTAKTTQNRLSFHISNFITSALQSIWGEDTYTFSLDFIEKRNKTEVQMILHTGEGDVSLENLNDIAIGGGVLDLVALALRIALWSLQANHQKVMILDQPLSNLDQNYLPKAGQLITELSEKLGIQFVMVNHNPALAGIATQTFEIEKEAGVSKIKK